MQFTRTILSIYFLFIYPVGYSQNLFANPGFEDINNCTEYHADCAPEAWFAIPANVYLVKGRVAPGPVLGNMILLVPVANVMANFNNRRRFVYTMLSCPLMAGEKYSLSFYINTANKHFERLDFYFTDKEPTLNNFIMGGSPSRAGSPYIDKIPSFSITPRDIDADYKMGWKHVKYEFTSDGNEQFCMIGNFSILQQSFEMKDAMNNSGDIFYFLDEILLKPMQYKTLCPDHDDNIKKSYDQNYRHSDNIRIMPDQPAKVIKPGFISDTIILPSILFDVNSAVLKPDITRILDSLTDKLIKVKIAKIEINGHTDNTGTATGNEALSISRALAVKKYFEEKMPQYADQIFTSGKGQQFPLAGNKTAAGRTKNRRVEIILTRMDGR
jgi:outer membrane protein OmpA-like peptidoglycan-associated protein